MGRKTVTITKASFSESIYDFVKRDIDLNIRTGIDTTFQTNGTTFKITDLNLFWRWDGSVAQSL